MQKKVYNVNGMHCSSCEIIIEKKLLQIRGVRFADARTDKNEVFIKHKGLPPSLDELNKIFKEDGYSFLESHNSLVKIDERHKTNDWLVSFVFALILISLFLFIQRLGIGGSVFSDSGFSLLMFIVLGLLAGISSCAALVGGIVLSMSKQWNDLYADRKSFIGRLEPHIMFNAGRILFFGFFGAILGSLGEQLKISLGFSSVFVITVSLIMVFLALGMMGFKNFSRFKISAPKFLTMYASDEKNFKGRFAPFLMGAFTFFLPCGFTITAQGLALLSGSAVKGALAMFLFAIGTLPSLFFIGIVSVKLLQNHNLSVKFLKFAGILILFFAFYNINSQLNVLGFKNFSDVFSSYNYSRNLKENNTGLAPIVEGKQVIKMDAFSFAYTPNYFKVSAGIPVRWEITDKGASGCTNAVISRGLFSGEARLAQGGTTIKEFTPVFSGKYKFSCWMGMVSGVIEVIEN